MPRVDAVRQVLDRWPFPVGPDDLALPGVDASMFQCAEHQIEWLNRLLSLGCVHPFEKAVDEGVVLERVFRAPLARWIRIAPLAAAVATAHKEVMVDLKDSTGVTAIVG